MYVYFSFGFRLRRVSFTYSHREGPAHGLFMVYGWFSYCLIYRNIPLCVIIAHFTAGAGGRGLPILQNRRRENAARAKQTTGTRNGRRETTPVVRRTTATPVRGCRGQHLRVRSLTISYSFCRLRFVSCSIAVAFSICDRFLSLFHLLVRIGAFRETSTL